MARIRAVFFDAIGTLFFPTAPIHETYAKVATQHGLRVDVAALPTRLRAAYGRQEKYDEAHGWVTSESREVERWRAVVFETLGVEHEACFQTLWQWYASPAAWRLHPEAEATICTLHERGTIIGIGSNLDHRLETLLAAFPVLAPLKERCVISSRVGYRKPAPAFFAELVRVAGCPPHAMLFIGDDLRNDYDGANAAGLNGILLDPLQGMQQGCIASLGEVPFFAQF